MASSANTITHRIRKKTAAAAEGEEEEDDGGLCFAISSSSSGDGCPDLNEYNDEESVSRFYAFCYFDKMKTVWIPKSNLAKQELEDLYGKRYNVARR